MTKKIFFAAAALLICLSVFCSCTAEDSWKGFDADNLSEYITVGAYKNLELTAIKYYVTDEEIDAYVNNLQNVNVTTAEITDRGAKSGDWLSVSYTGKINNATDKLFSADNATVIVGDGDFLTDFPAIEKSLEGKKSGESFEFSGEFPADYKNDTITGAETYAGKKIVFTVTVNKIYTVTYPEINDAFIKSVTEFDTLEEYRQSVYNELYEARKQNSENTLRNDAWSTLLNSSQIIKYPQQEIDKYKEDIYNYAKAIAEEEGMTFDEYLTNIGYTTESFETEAVSYAQDTVGEKLAMYSIANTENLSLSDDEYAEGAKRYAELYDFASVSELESQYDSELIRQSLLWDKITDFIINNSKVSYN